MSTVAEVLASIEAAQQTRAARAEQSDKFKRFYNSRAWRAARYRFIGEFRRSRFDALRVARAQEKCV